MHSVSSGGAKHKQIKLRGYLSLRTPSLLEIDRSKLTHPNTSNDPKYTCQYIQLPQTIVILDIGSHGTLKYPLKQQFFELCRVGRVNQTQGAGQTLLSNIQARHRRSAGCRTGMHGWGRGQQTCRAEWFSGETASEFGRWGPAGIQTTPGRAVPLHWGPAPGSTHRHCPSKPPCAGQP